ncbi:MAG: hypothetical protein IJ660_07405 [Alphaproteobacteria bacterium]|nr:hypothetical protein [Alphaproteobacteria bacterium]
MKKEKIKKTRPLTKEECAVSKKLYPYARKKFYARLMAGENSAEVTAWALGKIAHKEQEIDILEEVLEALTICEGSKLPELSWLKQALKVSLEANMSIYERQINLIVPLFYERKPETYEREFKQISYNFIDELAEKAGIFTGNMLTYLFAGDFFSFETGILLAKHREVLQPISSYCRMKLNTMLMVLAQKEKIISESSEDIAMHIFHLALKRPLYKEEASILIIYALMQLYTWDMIDTKTKPYAIPSSHTKDIAEVENAIAYCDRNGYEDLKKWQNALTLTEVREIWDKQVTLITKHLLKGGIADFTELKEITYRFIARSFRYGFLSSEIIDFIFDGRHFSNASTVILALSCNNLKEHNLASYIQEKLTTMIDLLIKSEWIEATSENIADYLLNNALVRKLNKEEISLLNLYVLSQAFK